MNNDRTARLTEFLNRVDRDRSHPNLRPKDAATMILIDRAEATPKVLLGRRHQGHKFLPGKFVFPGGRVEPSDRRVGVTNPLHPHVEELLLRGVRYPSAEKARAFALAAIRETFEETGLLLGVRRTDTAANAPWPRFAQAQIVPDLAQVHFIARAVTPPKRPRRFDTRFFAVDAEMIAARVDGIVGPDAELVELVWIPITEAKRLDLPPITVAVLEELQDRAAAGFGHDLPVPFYKWIGKGFRRYVI